MRVIYLDNYYGHFHPCEVDSLKYNPLTKKYSLYYFDRTLGDYMYAHLKKINDEFVITDYDYSNLEDASSALNSLISTKADVASLPPFVKLINHQNMPSDFTVCKSNLEPTYIFKKRLDYLEIESYEDALNGIKYYYFIVDEMIPSMDGFKYLARYVCDSKKPLKKNVIARHKLETPILDIPQEDGIYSFEFGLEDKIYADLDKEKLLVEKIIELNKGRRKEMDSVLLTKIVRMIIRSQDRHKAALEYQMYLSQFYDKWLKEKHEKHL